MNKIELPHNIYAIYYYNYIGYMHFRFDWDDLGFCSLDAKWIEPGRKLGEIVQETHVSYLFEDVYL